MRIDPYVAAFNAYRHMTTTGRELDKFVRKTPSGLQRSAMRTNGEEGQSKVTQATSHRRVAQENLSASETQLRNPDMALEMLNLTRQLVTSNADTALLAQANLVPESVFGILGD